MDFGGTEVVFANCMAIDTPARIAVLGAGPIGLEAALYARFLGYEVVVYEQDEVASSVRRSPQSPLSTPFRVNHSTLGLAALQAQDEGYQAPDFAALLTGAEWIDRYLAPLAATDLLADHLRLQTTVDAVEREARSSEEIDDDVQAWSFRVLSRSRDGEEQVELFHGVLDCTGVVNRTPWRGVNPPPSASSATIRLPYHTSEASYYILGSKSSPPGSDFQFQDGLSQIRDAFAIIGDRATLDLYAGATRLLR